MDEENQQQVSQSLGAFVVVALNLVCLKTAI